MFEITGDDIFLLDDADEPVTLAFAAAVIFLSALLRGYTGFGFALAAVPLLTLYMPPTSAVPVAVGLQLCGGLLDAPRARLSCHWPSVRWMTLGSVVGSPFGVWALASVSAPVARLVIAAICALAVLALSRGFRFAVQPRASVTAFVGALAGVFNGLAAMPGPAAVAYYIAAPLAPMQVRASLMIFFLASSVAATIGLLINDMLNTNVLQLIVIGLPLMTLGTKLGGRLFARGTGQNHRSISLVVLAVIALGSGIKALAELT